MRLTVAKLICSWCFCSWHSTSGSVPNQEHFFRAPGRSVRDLRTRKGTPRRQRQFRHEKARETFQPVEFLLEHDSWRDDQPGNRIVTYIVGATPRASRSLLCMRPE